MKAFFEHLAFASLSTKLRTFVLTWLDEIVRSTDDATLDSVIEDFSTLLYEGLDQIASVSRADANKIIQWYETVEPALLDSAVLAMLSLRRSPARDEPRRTFRAATPEQLRIIEEAQGEVGLDFRPFFPQLTSWQADCIIKGCVVVSEVQRQTGDRHFALRELRLAIRDYLVNRDGEPRRPNPKLNP